MKISKKATAVLLSAVMIVSAAVPTWAAEFSDGMEKTNEILFSDSEYEEVLGIESEQTEVTPTPELTPTPEITPSPPPFDPNDFTGTDWPYRFAQDVFDTNTGDCFGFACSVAMCAKELGYDPEIIITTGDHGFVIINGLYYDNMGGLFGASSHFVYSTFRSYKL